MDFQTSYVIFADVKGYSRFTEPQMQRFCQSIMPDIESKFSKAFYRNTWGDGFVAVYRDCINAAEAAFELRELFRNTRWEQVEFPPDLSIRIALHSGRIATHTDPRTKVEYVCGREVTRAARLEPIVYDNEIFCTELVVHTLRGSSVNICWDRLGNFPLAKDWGTETIYRLRRPSETELSKRSVDEISNIFKMPAQNSQRDLRMRTVLSMQCDRLDLLALSGFSYLHESGPNWKFGVREHLIQGRPMRVILAHPESGEVEIRKQAENRPKSRPFSKLSLDRLNELEKAFPTLTVRLSRFTLHCSLFFLSDSVFYDPYHLGCMPGQENGQNQLVVLEFSVGRSYDLLKRHFEFLWDNSVSLREVREHFRAELGSTANQ